MRLFLKVFFGLLAVAALAVAAFLIPPHLQTRRVEPELPNTADLRGLLAAENRPVRIRYVITSQQALLERGLSHSVFLVEWADGKWFMIDAGMDRKAAADFGELMKLGGNAGDVEIHGSIAELLGDDIGKVAGAGFTHLHIDHTQGVVPFCAARGAGAKLIQTSWQAELHNFNTEEGAELLAASCLEPAALAGAGVQTLQAFPGLGVVSLGGHTPGSTLFAAAVGDHIWLFSGDITNSKADMVEDRGKGFLYSYLLVPEHTERTAELRPWLTSMAAEADMTVVVSHDLGDIEASGLTEYQR